MSHFMSSMPWAGLIEMPPVSKVTPLPTKAMGRCLASGGAAPLHDDELGFMRRALADAEKRAHAELLHLLLAQHLDMDAEIGQLLRPLGESLRDR